VETSKTQNNFVVLVSLENETSKPCIRKMGLERLHGLQKGWNKLALSTLQMQKLSKQSSSTLWAPV
jgi:hypothetical protein